MVPYLTGGEAPTAARMNTLFEEADNKTYLALDGHCIPFLLGESKTPTLDSFSSFMGPAFVWATGAQLISGYWGATYDHAIYTAAVAAGNILTQAYLTSIGYGLLTGGYYYDTAQKWVRMRILPDTVGGFLRGSLEAHRISFTPPGGVEDDYWVMEMGGYPGGGFVVRGVERRRRLIQAEIILDGVTELDFLSTWTKYDYFRIHNCNSTPATVTFKSSTGTAHTVIVAAYGSACVRRTGVEGTYTDGLRYFQRFLPGDPRFFGHKTRHNRDEPPFTGNYGFPTSANNVACPAVLVPWVNCLLGGRPGFNSYLFPPTVKLDPSVRAPLPSRSAALYGDPANASTLVGDLLHHKGAFWDLELSGLGIGGFPVVESITVRNFTGYANIEADMAAQGVSVTFDGDDMRLKSSLTNQRDFISFGTNLFCTGNRTLQRTYVDGSNFITIDRHMPVREFYPMAEVTTNVTGNYWIVGPDGAASGLQNVTIPYVNLQESTDGGVLGETPKGDCAIVPHVDSVGGVTGADLGTLAGNPAYPDGTSDVTSWANVGFHLSGSGLWLTGERTTLLTAPPSGIRDVWPTLEGYRLSTRPWPGWPALGINRPWPWVWTCAFGGNPNNPLTDWRVSQVVSSHFEFYGWGNYDNMLDGQGWEFLPPGTGREYGDAMSGGGILLRHMDFDDPMTAEGSDVVYSKTETITTDISLLTPWINYRPRISTIGHPTPFDSDDSSLRVSFWPPVMMRCTDALIGALRNLAGAITSSMAIYWKNYRGAYLSGGIPTGAIHQTGSYAGVMQRYFRMALAAEHYNAFAEKVNQMVAYKPLNWIDHGVIMHPTDPTQRLRCYPTSIGLRQGTLASPGAVIYLPGTSAQIRPANQYWAAYASYDPLRQVFLDAGILKTKADLPASFADVLAATPINQRQRWNNSTIATDIVTFVGGGSPYRHEYTLTTVIGDFSSDAPQDGAGPERTDLAAIDEFEWVTIEDVKAYAEARGYKFLHSVIGVPLVLKQFEIPGEVTEIVRQVQGTAQLFNSQSTSMVGQSLAQTLNGLYRRSFTLFVVPEEEEGVEWLASLDITPYLGFSAGSLLAIERKADIFTRTHGSIVVGFDVPEQFREMYNGGPTGNNGASTTYGTFGAYPNTGDTWCTSVYASVWCSSGVVSNSQLCRIPATTVVHTENFSRTSEDAAWGRLVTIGTNCIPFTVVTKGTSANSTLIEANQSARFTAGPDGYKVVLLEDFLVPF